MLFESLTSTKVAAGWSRMGTGNKKLRGAKGKRFAGRQSHQFETREKSGSFLIDDKIVQPTENFPIKSGLKSKNYKKHAECMNNQKKIETEETTPHWFRERAHGIISYDSSNMNPERQTKIFIKLPHE